MTESIPSLSALVRDISKRTGLSQANVRIILAEFLSTIKAAVSEDQGAAPTDPIEIGKKAYWDFYTLATKIQASIEEDKW